MPSATLTVQAQILHCSYSLSLFISQMSANCEPLGDFLSLSQTSCLSLCFFSGGLSSGRTSLYCYTFKIFHLQTPYFGKQGPQVAPQHKNVEPGKAQSSAWSCPLGGDALALALCYSTETFCQYWKILSPLHEHAIVPKPKLRTCLCQCAP